jgi:hypothetical protein
MLPRAGSQSIAPCGWIKFLPIAASLQTCRWADDAAHPAKLYYTETVDVNLCGGNLAGLSNLCGCREVGQVDRALRLYPSASLSPVWRRGPTAAAVAKSRGG